MEQKIYFQEKQFMRKSRLMIFLYLPMFVVSITLYYILFIEKKGEYTGPLLCYSLGLIIAVFMTIIKPETYIKEGSFTFILYPLQLRYQTIAVSDIEFMEVKEYSPIAEFGGWGVRQSSSSRIYSISGK